ncbi:50S ribosomal protein L14 [Porphyridium purpureum]|uniref:50S ribosomal protein L14 n=1 Tax=Porphyridium purpureum TaxID=35688 RepID=A0A5J4Z4W1_PORPP|nr:50S ribosomal protein L14 [Porphyridium purpureum]|eukprot:POR6234..scf295_1
MPGAGIQMMTRLRVADNSGARVVGVIRVMRVRRRTGTVGDEVVCSIKEADPGAKKVKKGEVHRAVVVRGKVEDARRDGSTMRCSDWAAALLGPNGQPIGTRIRGVVSSNLDRSKYMKIMSLCRVII